MMFDKVSPCIVVSSGGIKPSYLSRRAVVVKTEQCANHCIDATTLEAC